MANSETTRLRFKSFKSCSIGFHNKCIDPFPHCPKMFSSFSLSETSTGCKLLTTHLKREDAHIFLYTAALLWIHHLINHWLKSAKSHSQVSLSILLSQKRKRIPVVSSTIAPFSAADARFIFEMCSCCEHRNRKIFLKKSTSEMVLRKRLNKAERWKKTVDGKQNPAVKYNMWPLLMWGATKNQRWIITSKRL